MTTRLSDPTTTTDPVVRGILVVTMAVTIVGVLALIRAAGGRVHHVTVRVDNQAGLPVQVDVAGPDGGRLGLGEAGAQETTTFEEVADPGRTWTFVVSYGGQELVRQPVGRQDLAGRDWTFQVPGDVTMELERQGYR